MPPRRAQLDLFGTPNAAPAIDFTAEAALARRLPVHVRFGTSSWTFPGWAGVVYPAGTTESDLLDRGLELYVRHPLFRTVGIDRSYYRPLERADLADYADQLPKGFRCVSKVWNEITSFVHPVTREPNPRFLDPGALEEEVLGPIADAFADHAGPLVFEIAPIPSRLLPSSTDFCRMLDAFFGVLPHGFAYAVELRNRELFTPRYLDVLGRHGVAHVLNFWERMPAVGEQLDAPGVLPASHVVARLLVPPGRRYAERKRELAPFDRIADPQEAMRADVVRLAEECGRLAKTLWIVVNNKAEGSSPLTIRALAERVAARSGRIVFPDSPADAGESAR